MQIAFVAGERLANCVPEFAPGRENPWILLDNEGLKYLHCYGMGEAKVERRKASVFRDCRKLRGNGKTIFAFRFKSLTSDSIKVMAKSIRISDVTETDPLTSAPSSHGFWEHWFEMQPAKHHAPGTIDEHGIWEKAVSLEILAMNETKY